jgi:hypothetical protein
MELIMEKFRMNNLKLNTLEKRRIRQPMISSVNQAGISQEQIDSASFYTSLKDTTLEN